MNIEDRKDNTKTKLLVSWLCASGVCFIAATLSHSQQVQANLIDVGASLDMPTRLTAMSDDLLGLGPTYLPIIAIGFAIAFSVAAVAARKTKLSPLFLYTLAGATAIGAILGLMRPIMEITLIAGARGGSGFALQIMAGALGGLAYAYLVQRRKESSPR